MLLVSLLSLSVRLWELTLKYIFSVSSIPPAASIKVLCRNFAELDNSSRVCSRYVVDDEEMCVAVWSDINNN